MSRSSNYIPLQDVLHKIEIIGNKCWPSDTPIKSASSLIVTGDSFFDGRVNICGNLTVSGSTNIGSVETDNFALTGGQEAWILRSDSSSKGFWGKPYFKTNDDPLLNISGPSDNIVHTEYSIGIGITNTTEKLEVGGNVIIGDQFIGNYNGSPTDTTIISHKTYKSDNDGYAIKIKNDSQLDLNSKVDMNFNISDEQVMTIDSFGNVGIGITQPNENLHVAGNVQIDGNLNVEGSLTYIKSTVVEVNDPNLFLARNNPSDVIDIGFFGQYVDNGTTKFTGLFRDASGTEGYYTFFHNLEEKPTTTVNTVGTGYQNGNLHLGGLQIDNGITFTTNDAFIYEDNLVLDSRAGDGTGFVGIGISDPLDSMDVNNGVIIRNGNLKIGITSSNASVHINRDDVIVIPVGSTLQRLDITGGIRYNSDNDVFEGYNGSSWDNFGSLSDIDHDTYISAEDSSGTDNDQLKFYTASTQKMIIDTNGNIGIGTENPEHSMHIQNDQDSTTFIEIQNSDTGTSATTGLYLVNDNSSSNIILNGSGYTTNGADKADGLTITTSDSASGGINISALTGGIELYTGDTSLENTTSRMKIDNDGNIGINNSSPVYQLDINGNIGISGNIIPKLNETFDLGTTTMRFKDLFLSGQTIHLGDTKISESTGILTINELHVTSNMMCKSDLYCQDVFANCSIDITGNLNISGNIIGYSDFNIESNGYINNLNITNNLTVSSNLDIHGIAKINSLNITENITSNSLNITGNAEIDGNLIIDGDLTVHGTTISINTEIVTIDDPMIELASNNKISDIIDIGFYGKYINNGITKYSGLVRDATNDNFRLFTTEEQPTTTINIDDENFTDAKLLVGDLVASGSVNITNNLIVDTNTLFVDVSTDRVGINNPIPETTLHLIGTDGLVIPVGTNAQRVDVTGTIRYNTENSTFEGYKGTWGSLGGVIDIDQDTYISAETSDTDNDELKFVTMGNERMIINSNGNIGIGTNVPNYPLHIEKINLDSWSTKIINSDTEILIANTNGSALNINSGVSSNNTNYIMNVKNNTNSSILTIMNNENIGINNVNPTEKLDIGTTNFSEGANIGYGFIGNSVNEITTTIFTHKDLKLNINEYAIKQDSSGKTTLNTKTGTDLDFRTNDISNIIIKSDGKIGIHTLTPNANVEIQDNTLINSQSNISLTVTNSLSDVYIGKYDGSGILVQSGTNQNYALQCKENTNKLFEVLNTGKVVIGITETDSKLSVEDNLTINHNNSYIKSNTTDSLNTINSNVPIALGVSENNILYINDSKVSIGSDNINYQKFNIDGSQYISESLLINTTSSNYQLDVSGNTKLNGDVLISGLLTFEGVAVDGLEFQDSLIKFGNNNTDNTEDIGFYGQYVDSLTTKYAGIIKDASDDKFKLFKDLETEPTTKVDLTDITYTYADLALNNLETSGNIGVNIVNPQYSVHINTNDAIIIPVGTNAQRVDVTGAIRYNSEIETFEGYKGTWGSLGGVIDVDQDTYVSAETSAGTDNDELKFVTDGSERMIINSIGNIGIGIIDPTYALDVNGIIQSNEEIFAPEFTTACDIRVKENIKRMNVNGILEKVNKLNLYEYNYVNTYNKSNDKIYGLIAQNVKEVMPEAIKYKKLKVGDKYIDDFQTISQNTLISSLIGCIHELTDNQRKLGEELYKMKMDYYDLKESLILKKELEELKK